MLKKHQASPARSAAACLLLALLLAAAAAARQEQTSRNPDPMDWVFVVDTSESMIGKGRGAQNVFSQVQETLTGFVQKSRPGDTIIIYTFDEKTRFVHKVQIKNDKDKSELVNAVAGLAAKGQWTYTGDAVSTALKRIRDLEEEYKGQNHETTLVLFTDGKEDHNPRAGRAISLGDIPEAEISGVSPYTFIVWLNRDKLPRELTDFADKSNGTVIQFSTPSEIPGAVNAIIEGVPARVTMHPTSLDFGKIEPGDAVAGSVNFNSNKKTSLRVTLEGADGAVTLAEPQGVVTLEAEKDTAVTVRLQSSPQIADGAQTGRVVFTVDEAVSRVDQAPEGRKKREPLAFAYAFRVERVPVLRKLLMWLAAAFGLLALAYAALYFWLGGVHPLPYYRERRNLEGELSILFPEEAEGKIRLGDENVPRARLSDLQTGRLRELLDGADAELATARDENGKLVTIQSLQGMVRVQDQEVASGDLYNDDIIEVGGVTLRYHGRRERPEVSERAEYSEAAF